MSEHFDAEAEFKFADADATTRGEFIGYASTFGNVDLGGDIVEAGAFRDTLAKRGAGGVAMLWGHDPRQPPIGKWLEIREDDKGLVARGQLILDIAKARDVHAGMREGALKGLSIGYRIPAGGAEMDRRGVRRLKTLDLHEVSVVTFPMNTRSQVSRVKAAAMTEREIERLLTQDAGMSRSEARAIMRGGLTALKAMQDAGDDGFAEIAAQIKRNASILSPSA